jgi:hypothetical protein
MRKLARKRLTSFSLVVQNFKLNYRRAKREKENNMMMMMSKPSSASDFSARAIVACKPLPPIIAERKTDFG